MIYAVVILSVLLALSVAYTVWLDRFWQKQHSYVCDLAMKLADEAAELRKGNKPCQKTSQTLILSVAAMRKSRSTSENQS